MTGRNESQAAGDMGGVECGVGKVDMCGRWRNGSACPSLDPLN